MQKIVYLFIICVFSSFVTFGQKEAAHLYKQARKLKEQGALPEAAENYNRAGNAWIDKDSTKNARNAFLNSIEINKKLGNYNAVAHLYNTLGRIYAEQTDYDKAIHYLNTGLQLTQKYGESMNVASVQINLGNIQAETGNLTKAITQTKAALTKALEANNLSMITEAYKSLSEYHEQKGNAEQATEYFDKYRAFEHKLQKQKEAQAQKRMENIEEEAQKFRKKKEKQEKTLRRKKLRVEIMKDSLSDFRELRKKQQVKIDLLNKKKRIQKLELQKEKAKRREERIIRIFLIVGLLIVIGFSGFLFKINRQRQKANKQLKQQNAEIQRQNEKIKEQRRVVEESRQELETANQQLQDKNIKITNSINYARTIQQAMLPSFSQLNSFLNDSFVLFRPKDIVSGDFYWYTMPNGGGNRSFAESMIDAQNTDSQELLLSAVDCTGHGVPGAFMSMIGYSLLNEIVDNGINSPEAILEELDNRVKMILKKNDTQSNDGMDMALLRINQKTNEVRFSGAHNPVVYVQDGEVKEIKGASRSIGGKSRIQKRKNNKTESFDLTTIQVNQPMEFYIFSDGYKDQFGGPKNRKFMLRRLKQIIGEIHQKPMDQQKTLLENYLDEWQGNQSQLDDVLVIGFRIYPK